MFTVFAWYKWRNCSQSRLVLGKLFTIAVFLKQIATLNIFFCVFVCFSRHKAQTLPRGPFLRVTETPSQNRERPHSSREEEEEDKEEDKEEEEEEKKS